MMWIKLSLALVLIVPAATYAQTDSVQQPMQRLDAPFRLFGTQNMHTFLKLDTRTGRVWQIQWGTDDGYTWVAGITALLAWVAWRQLGSLVESSTSDFLLRLKSDFFTEPTRKLVFLIEQGLLKFEDGTIPYFSIPDFNKPELKPRLQELGITESTISTYFLDDIILGPLEDVAFYLSEKRITRNQAYEVFSYYICICAESPAIQDYKKACRKRPGDADIYSGLDHLEKLMCQESAARN